MVLYDRTQLSARNEWVKDGKVYTVYPVADLAQAVHKSVPVIQRALTELESAGLLKRDRHGPSRASTIFLMLPECAEDPPGLRTENSAPTPVENDQSDLSEAVSQTNRKRSVRPVENDSPDLSETIDETCRKRSPNKRIYITDNNHTIKAYGIYANVLLTEQAHAGLKQELGGQLGALIDRMSRYLHRTGKRYTDYAAALRRWAAKEPAGEQPVWDPYDMDIPYEEGSSL